MVDANEIKAFRLTLGKNQEDFAALLGITRQQLSRVERGECRLTRNVENRFKRLIANTFVIPTFKVTSSRGVTCPFCGELEKIEHINIDRIAFDESDNVYQCMTCKRIFTQRESFRLIDEQRK